MLGAVAATFVVAGDDPRSLAHAAIGRHTPSRTGTSGRKRASTAGSCQNRCRPDGAEATSPESRWGAGHRPRDLARSGSIVRSVRGSLGVGLGERVFSLGAAGSSGQSMAAFAFRRPVALTRRIGVLPAIVSSPMLRQRQRGDVAEWFRQRPAKPCIRVRFPASPRHHRRWGTSAVGSGGERVPTLVAVPLAGEDRAHQRPDRIGRFSALRAIRLQRSRRLLGCHEIFLPHSCRNHASDERSVGYSLVRTSGGTHGS